MEALREGLAALLEGLGDLAAVRTALDERVQPMLRAIVDEESDNRRKLYELRADPAYQSAYTDPDPLVSIVIATVGRHELVSRALPSLLAQSHSNVEILVVGDHSPPEVAEAIREIGDARVRYWNLTQRLVAHSDSRRSWLVGSTMARNEAARRARGRWLLYFDDDDRLRPDSIARLLTVAREHQAEVSYGGFRQCDPDGRVTSHIAFPPQWGNFAWPAALVHGGLRFFERELVATHLELPGDIYLLTRMLRVGVRFAMLDDIVLDYFPSSRWQPNDGSGRPSVLASLTHHDGPGAEPRPR
ncbi:MAG: glycosyltransferase family 2 protein [Gaiellaceae bacterium]